MNSRQNKIITHKNNNFCNNCGKLGHLYGQCSKPITSTGIILFNKIKNKKKYLLICRKDSLGYVEFLRGKYPLYNQNYIQNIINEMTISEKEKILNFDFSKLWKELWGDFYGSQYKSEERNAKEKFKQLKEGILLFDDSFFSLSTLIENSTTDWQEPEWGFPKGRRNYQESDIQCALREFSEETGISKLNLKIIKNIMPFDEIFTGSNFKSYRHRYFLAYTKSTHIKSKIQQSEVSKINWLTLDECLQKIRPYNLERKQLIQNTEKVLNKYSLIL